MKATEDDGLVWFFIVIAFYEAIVYGWLRNVAYGKWSNRCNQFHEMKHSTAKLQSNSYLLRKIMGTLNIILLLLL